MIVITAVVTVIAVPEKAIPVVERVKRCMDVKLIQKLKKHARY